MSEVTPRIAMKNVTRGETVFVQVGQQGRAVKDAEISSENTANSGDGSIVVHSVRENTEGTAKHAQSRNIMAPEQAAILLEAEQVATIEDEKFGKGSTGSGSDPAF